MQPQIDYWSYSSMSALLSNPLNFKKKYILKVYDDPMSPSGVVGTACHKVAEAYFGNGKSEQEAIQAGYDYIDSISHTEIDYGKTGSKEKILKDFDASYPILLRGASAVSRDTRSRILDYYRDYDYRR
jgi:hypothetical protein